MNVEDPDPEPDPALRRALESAPPPSPNLEFSAGLRARFLEQADVDEGAAELEYRPWAEPAREVAPGAPVPERSPWLRLASIAAIAAAAVLLFRWPAPRGWRVEPSSAFEYVRVDGKAYFPADADQLGAAVLPGSLVEVTGGPLTLVLDQRVALSLASGSALTLVRVPEPGILDPVHLKQERGSLALATGPDFEGASLRIQTPDVDVRVEGTEFALDVIADAGTCVCCAQGSVAVFASPDPAVDAVAHRVLAAREMIFLSHTGKPEEQGPAVEAHLASLPALRAVWSGQ